MTANFIVGSRLMLHLRQLYYSRPAEVDEETTPAESLSGMRFEERRTVTIRSRVLDGTFSVEDGGSSQR